MSFVNRTFLKAKSFSVKIVHLLSIWISHYESYYSTAESQPLSVSNRGKAFGFNETFMGKLTHQLGR